METVRTSDQPSQLANTEPAAPPVMVVPLPIAPKRGRRPFLILGILALGTVAGVGAYHLLTASQEATDDAQVAADMVPVAARVGGMLARVSVVENQLVKRGDLLAQIDPAEYAARVEQAEAEVDTARAQASAAAAQVQIVEATSKGGLASARAALSGSASSVLGADAQLVAARAAVARASAELRKAELDCGRARALASASAISREQLDAAETGLETARAAKAQADAQVALAEESRRGAQSRVGEARGRVSQSAPIAPQIAAARAGADLAGARVRGAEAALALAKLQLGYTRIVAPADGYASKLTAHDGQLVSIGQPVVELVPAATYVIANYKETQIGRMRPGQRATIEVDGLGGRTLEGRVESLSGGTGASFSLLPADNATGSFVKVVQRVPVRIAWVSPPGDLALRAGLSADVTVYVDK